MIEEENIAFSPGCTVVYGFVLGLAGLGILLWALAGSLLGQGPGSLAVALDLTEAEPVVISAALAGLFLLVIGAGMAWGKTWAWWLVLLLHLLGLLLSLLGLFLPLFFDREQLYLGTPLPALMGLVVNFVLLAYFWQARNEQLGD